MFKSQSNIKSGDHTYLSGPCLSRGIWECPISKRPRDDPARMFKEGPHWDMTLERVKAREGQYDKHGRSVSRTLERVKAREGQYDKHGRGIMFSNNFSFVPPAAQDSFWRKPRPTSAGFWRKPRALSLVHTCT